MVTLTYDKDGNSSIKEPISAFEVSEIGKISDISHTDGDVTTREVEFENGGKVHLVINKAINSYSYKSENVLAHFKSNKDDPETVTLIISMKEI